MFKWNTANLFVYYFIINDSSPMILFCFKICNWIPRIFLILYLGQSRRHLYDLKNSFLSKLSNFSVFRWLYEKRIDRIFKIVSRLRLKDYYIKKGRKTIFLFFWKFWKNDHFLREKYKNSKQHFTVTLIKYLSKWRLNHNRPSILLAIFSSCLQ